MKALEEIARLQQKLEDGTLPPDEPLFVLRGQDKTAADTIRRWANDLASADGPADKVQEARQIAEQFDCWPVKQVPGVPAKRAVMPTAATVRRSGKQVSLTAAERWTDNDDRVAARDGWGLFSTGAGDTGMQIQALDDPGEAEEEWGIQVDGIEGEQRDHTAASRCQRKADAGGATAQKAIEILLAADSPDIALFNLRRNWK